MSKRCLLVSFHSSMVVVLSGIFIFRHPYRFAAGAGPDAFEWLMAGGGESR